MILSKDIETFLCKYGWVDGIVTDIRWDSNLFDLLISIYTYEGKEIDGKDLTIRFKNCIEANFIMTKHFHTVPRNELKDYMLSWYTVTGCDVNEVNGFVEVEIRTSDYNSRWLTVKCEDIWVEGEEK